MEQIRFAHPAASIGYCSARSCDARVFGVSQDHSPLNIAQCNATRFDSQSLGLQGLMRADMRVHPAA